MDDSAEMKQRLYRENEQRINAVVYRMCDDPDLAADVVQDVWVHIFRGLPKFRNESLFSTWATRIAFNVTTSALRNRQRRDKREVEIQDDSASTECNDELVMDSISNALPKLGKQERTVFELHDLRGYSHGEIGRKIGITDGGSRTALCRARASLRVLL